MRRGFRGLFVFAAALALGTGCEAGGGSAAPCLPGTSVACPCLNGTEGARVCGLNAALGPCECGGAVPDGGGGGADSGSGEADASPFGGAGGAAASDASEPDGAASDAGGAAGGAGGTGGGTPDDLPPTVGFEAPADGAFLNGEIELAAAADDDVGVVGVQFFVDNGLLTDDRTVPYRHRWPSDEFDEGPHMLKAIASDTTQQTGEAEVTVIVDRTPPSIAIVRDGDGPVHDRVTLGFELEDASPITSIDVAVLVGDVAGAGARLDAPPWTIDLDVSALPAGEHAVVASAVDSVGLSAEATAVFVVDRPPVLAFVAPAADALVEGPIDIVLTAEDDGSADGLVVEVFVDGESIGETDRNGRLAWTPAYRRGRRRLEAVATDALDQVVRVERDITVDHPVSVELIACAPVCAAPTPGQVVSGRVTFRSNVRDDGNGIARVELRVDESLVATDETPPFVSSWITEGLGDGEYTVVLRAYNLAGDTGEATHVFGVNNCDRDGDGARAGGCGGDDCDDEDGARRPGAADRFGDGVDQDCDGEDGVDADGDGIASEASGGSDCRDNDRDIRPGAPELCDRVDQDCDGEIDEEPANAPTWYFDFDGDDYGDPDAPRLACEVPGGYVDNDDDCNDDDGADHPEAVERCDDLDNDCDGEVDEDAPAERRWYADADDDGFGDPNTFIDVCASPADYVDNALDCNDEVRAIHPDAVDVCDGVDDNCAHDEDDCRQCADALEPNDTRATAASVGPGDFSDLGICDGLDDHDVYAVALAAGETLVVDVFFVHADGDIEARLYGPDSAEDALVNAFTSTDNEHLEFTAPRAGAYLVNVFGSGDASNNYSMRIAIEPALSCDDAFEPNNDPGEASVAAPPVSAVACVDDADLFAVEVAGELEVFLASVSVDEAVASVAVTVLGTDGATALGRSETTDSGDEAGVAVQFDAAGTYYLRVDLEGEAPTGYTLAWEASVCEDDELEDNDSLEASVAIEPGVVEAHGCPADADFYRVAVDAERFVQATLEYATADGAAAIALIDADGAVVAESDRRHGREIVRAGAEVATTYAVRVTSVGVASLPYTLAVELSDDRSAEACFDRFEPNDSAEIATPIGPGVYAELDVCPNADESDFFTFDAAVDQLITVELAFTDEIADIDLRLFDPAGTRIASSSSVSDDERIDRVATMGGAYVIEVYHYSGANNGYDLVVAVE